MNIAFANIKQHMKCSFGIEMIAVGIPHLKCIQTHQDTITIQPAIRSRCDGCRIHNHQTDNAHKTVNIIVIVRKCKTECSLVIMPKVNGQCDFRWPGDTQRATSHSPFYHALVSVTVKEFRMPFRLSSKLAQSTIPTAPLTITTMMTTMTMITENENENDNHNDNDILLTS